MRGVLFHRYILGCRGVRNCHVEIDFEPVDGMFETTAYVVIAVMNRPFDRSHMM